MNVMKNMMLAKNKECAHLVGIILFLLDMRGVGGRHGGGDWWGRATLPSGRVAAAARQPRLLLFLLDGGRAARVIQARAQVFYLFFQLEQQQN